MHGQLDYVNCDASTIKVIINITEIRSEKAADYSFPSGIVKVFKLRRL
jgi:hypothetical protein